MRRLAAGFLLLAASVALARAALDRAPAPALGVTFSTAYARELGEDPEEAFRAIVEELGARRVRLPVYWSDVEPVEGERDFSRYDRLVAFAQDHGVALTVVVGAKVPRWPECFAPAWSEGLTGDRMDRAVLSFVRATVQRYRGIPAVERWQVENEAFFPFGVCPVPDLPRLREEVALVRALDARPVQMTASGELESWALVGGPADVLGVSMYRTTWNDRFGYFRYPIPPWAYRLRAALVSPLVSRTIVSELQAEPWFYADVRAKPLSYWARAFTSEDLRENVAYASATGLPEAYLWGAEWWYHLMRNGYPGLWDEAKELFIRSP